MTKKTFSPSQPHFITGTIDAGSWRPEHPISVGGCLIMKCEQGLVDLSINSRRFTMRNEDMAFIVFDMTCVPVRLSDDFKARFISLVFETAQDIFFLVTSNRFWEHVYSTPVFELNKNLRGVCNHWFHLANWAASNCSEKTYETVLRNEMENFMLVMAEQVEKHFGTLGENPPKNRAWVIVNKFLGLLNHYYARHHDVAFYAGKLNITPNYLNIISRKNLGISAKEQISIQLGLAIKMLLDTTDMTVKEIATSMHYDDPSYLCRMFKKQTGLTPLQYRNIQRSNKKGRQDV